MCRCHWQLPALKYLAVANKRMQPCNMHALIWSYLKVVPELTLTCFHHPVFMHILTWWWFWLVWTTVNANNVRINSSMCIKKVMWLCTIGWDNLTNRSLHSLSNYVLVVLQCLSQSLSSKTFCIIASQNCLTLLRSQTAGHLRKQWLHLLFRLLTLRRK